jgi:hypothetical protein
MATADERLRRLARKVRKIFELESRGATVDEREAARKKIDDLLAEHHLTLADLPMLLSLSADPASSSIDDQDDAPPTSPASAQQEGNDPDVLILLNWALKRHLCLEGHQLTGLALWALHTFLYDQFEHSPRLAILSPVLECGKSDVFRLLEKLCWRARRCGSFTSAALSRMTNERFCVLCDEADNADLFHDKELRRCLNDGFTEGGKRALTINGKAVDLNLHAPTALAGIGRLPVTTMSRSIVINMSRAPAAQQAAKMRLNLKNPKLLEELDTVFRLAYQWSLTVRGTLDTDPPIPKGFYGRRADRWRPLFSIADKLGHGKVAREAAKFFAGEFNDQDAKTLLLSDIRDVFGVFADDRISRETLLKLLHEHEEGRWLEFRGEKDNQEPKLLTLAAMTKMLADFQIRTKTIWPRRRTAESKSRRGYLKSQFERAWASYCDDQDDDAPVPNNVKHLRRS